MMSFAPKRGMGWLPDYPDFRDYTEDIEAIQDLLRPASAAKSGETAKASAASSRKRTATKAAGLPSAVDLRPWCSPVEDQGGLGSCTAHLGVGIIEYYERKAFGRHTDASRLFLYKVTRNLMKAKGDTDAYLRTAIGAMDLFGTPHEEYWPYTDGEKKFDAEPNAFTVYGSIEQADKTGRIPYPSSKEKIDGGHAVGYEDKLKIKNTHNKAETTGALFIRNSWGTG